LRQRVLHIIDSLEVGGAERLLVDTINNLPELEHHLVTLTDKIALISELKQECKKTHLGFKSKKDVLRCIRSIRKYIKDNSITVVHSHLVMSNIFARLASPRHVGVFNSLHNLNGEKFFTRWSWQRFIEKWTYNKRHHIIAVSQEVLEDYKKNIGLKGKATILHNFVDDRFFASGPKIARFNDVLRTVAVGSFKPQKNYNFLIEVFKQLPENIKLDIYGDGPLRPEIEKKIQVYGLRNVRVCGIEKCIEKKIPEYDLYVMSSTAEGHPIALLEAMACGMPVMVSDIPVLREATNNFSIYFDLESKDDFIKKIKEIASAEIDIDKYAEHNFSYANQIGRKDNYLKRLIALYISSAS